LSHLVFIYVVRVKSQKYYDLAIIIFYSSSSSSRSPANPGTVL